MLSQDAGIGAAEPDVADLPADPTDALPDAVPGAPVVPVPAQRGVPGAESVEAAEAAGAVDEAGADRSAPPPTLPAADEDRWMWPRARRQIAVAVCLLSALVMLTLLGHRYVPDTHGVGSMIDTFLPWALIPLLIALPAALVSLSRWAIGLALLGLVVWGADFGPTLMSRGSSGPADLRVLSQNVSSQTPDLAADAALALRQDADVVVLQGMGTDSAQAAGQAVPSAYRYHLSLYEFTVWSKYPISGIQPVDLADGSGPAVSAATRPTGVTSVTDSGLFGGLLKFDVRMSDQRTVVIYAVHLPQPALSHSGFAVARDTALASLVAAIRAERAPQLIVVGDLDLAPTDRRMQDLLGGGTGLESTQEKAGSGFGFTWPAGFPVIRLDDVLVRGLTPVRADVLTATGTPQAHRPIEADLRF